MKLRNLVSAFAAAALALTSAVSVCAEKVAVDCNDAKYLLASGDKGKYVNLYQYDKEKDTKSGYCVDTDLPLSDICGFKVYVKFDQAELDAGTWVAGGVALNSESTGWDDTEWAAQEGAKPISANLEEGSITFFDEEEAKPLFKDTDTYCQVHFQTWGGTVEIVKFELLSRKGRVLTGYAEAPAATEPVTPVEPTEEATEPTVEATEPTVEATEPTVEATEPTVEATEPTVEATEPTVEATEPTVEATTPTEDATAPTEDASEGEDNTSVADPDNGEVDNKGNVDTGVEGVAVVVGLAAVAGAAFVISRKRK